MIKRISIHLLVQLVVILLVGSIAGFTALISFGAIGGVAMGIAPDSTFSLIEGIVCPEGTSLKYYQIKRSYHEPGESEPHVECIEAGQVVSEDVLPEAVLVVLGLSFAGVFLAVFVPVFIILAIIAFILTRMAMTSSKNQAQA